MIINENFTWDIRHYMSGVPCIEGPVFVLSGLAFGNSYETQNDCSARHQCNDAKWDLMLLNCVACDLITFQSISISRGHRCFKHR